VKLPPVADVVVVGAGLTGASTVLHLAERRPDLEVVLLEAVHVAAGASGHGTGLLGPRLGPPIEVARRRDGDPVARRRYVDSVAAVERVLALAGRWAPQAIGPGLGQLIVAQNAAEASLLRRRARAYATLGLYVPLTDTAEPWAAATRTALAYAPAAGVDPGLLTRGLVAAAAARGVQLLEQAPVLGLRPGPAWRPVQVVTGHGTIAARAVVLAVDVTRHPGALPVVAGQLALQVSASVTDPLPEGLIDELGGPAAPHILSAAALGPYRRLTADGRIVIGGGPAAVLAGATPRALAAAERRAQAWQRRQLDAVHPGLARVAISRCWSGRISLTRDGLPQVGRLLLPGLPSTAEVWSAGGWNGHGLAATVTAGQRLADRVLAGATDAPLRPIRWPLGSRRAAPIVRAALRLSTPAAPRQPVRGSTVVGSVPVPTREESLR
jgi:glycine/D-amino acid oxidase-like deaminating enzyme